MSLGARIFRNTTFLTLGDKIGYLIQFLFFLYFARTFGVVPTGEYSFAFTYTYTFVIFADLGISIYLVREVARSDVSDRQLFYDCLVLRTFAIIVFFILASVVLLLFFNDISHQKLSVILCWGIYSIFYSLADVFLAELNGREKMGRVALMGIWLRFMIFIGGISLILFGLNYNVVLIVLPLSAFIYLCSCIIVSIYSFGPIRLHFRKIADYKNLLLKLVPFFSALILITILYVQDVLLLGIIRDDQSVGIYSSALKIVSFIHGVSIFINIAILPVLSKLYIESKERLIDISNKILKYLVLLSLPICFGLTLTSDKIINLLYSESFQGANIVLKILSWTIVVGFIQTLLSAFLTAINRQKEKVVFVGINLFISILLNILFIIHLNYLGAAVAKIISSIIGLAFFIYLVSKYMEPLPIFGPMLKPVLACLIMSIFIHYFPHWNLFYLVPTSGFIYVIALLLMGGFKKGDIRFLKSLIPNKQ